MFPWMPRRAFSRLGIPAQRVVWSVESPGMSDGGTLATAGNLVFQGRADSRVHAYSADQGRDLWSFDAGVAVTGVPITYSVQGASTSPSHQVRSMARPPPTGRVGALGLGIARLSSAPACVCLGWQRPTPAGAAPSLVKPLERRNSRSIPPWSRPVGAVCDVTVSRHRVGRGRQRT
jgi:hypothetical protein